MVMGWIAGALGGGTGVFMLLNRQWTLTLTNNSHVTLIPAGTSESSGSLNSPLKEIKPGCTEKFIWKKTAWAEAGAVGALHFQVGYNVRQPMFFTVYGSIPMNMTYFKSGCNIHIGENKPSVDDLENGTNGCQPLLEAGQFGKQPAGTYTISNKAEADFNVTFDYKL